MKLQSREAKVRRNEGDRVFLYVDGASESRRLVVVTPQKVLPFALISAPSIRSALSHCVESDRPYLLHDKDK
jgi:hypothetical protein